ncbi:hypothetical protein EDD37DRAFT_636319 [Exophiala viscosa]|uniref:uncharacterized protein n=1 Tax=Exophiala viscosa TaxID=2486360 RepID=UPI0021A24636|nr:hypothetical protein EDD37DRAFT_636319 [Exophiala viscosa]
MATDQVRRKRTTFFRVANVCTVLILAYSILCISSFLVAKQAVCSTTATGIYFAIAFSIPTILTAGLRCYLIFRQRQNSQTISPSLALPRLDSACVAAVQCLVALWMILAGCSLLPIALRAPVCLSQPLPQWQGDLAENNWRYGLSCRLHRAVVALSVIMAVSICAVSFFDNTGRREHRRGSSYLCCYWRVSRREPKHRPAPSISSTRSASEVDKHDRLFLVPETRPSRFEHEQWLQRRNSLSSQRAIYPHKYHYYDPRSRYVVHSYAPSSRYPSTLRSVSEGRCLDLSDRSSSVMLRSSQSSGSLATLSRPTTMVGTARCRSSSTGSPGKPGRAQPRRSSASAAAHSVPDVPFLPPLPALPAPTWSPSLQHTPLSADPTIRALSMGVVLAQSQQQPQLPPRHKSRTHIHDGIPGTLPGVKLNAQANMDVLREIDGNASSPRVTAPVPPMPQKPPPTLPPPPPPALTGPKIANIPVPPLPVRAPDHFVFPQSTRQTLRQTSSPRRYRQYYNTPHVHRGTSGHRKGDATASVSNYSASSSSYGSGHAASTIGKNTCVRKT